MTAAARRGRLDELIAGVRNRTGYVTRTDEVVRRTIVQLSREYQDCDDDDGFMALLFPRGPGRDGLLRTLYLRVAAAFAALAEGDKLRVVDAAYAIDRGD